MLQKRNLIIDYFLYAALIFSLICFLLRAKGAYTVTTFNSEKSETAYKDEDFDISLMRINSMDALQKYCDSLHKAAMGQRSYPGIVSEVLRNRFYHGYSYYDTGNNPMAIFTAPLIKDGITAIVVPDDILKFPNAACSQQSIVGMELLKRKGFPVRKVAMFDDVQQVGHFSYEAFYNGDWHYFDSNIEPDVTVLRKFDRPSVAFLKKHPEIVAAAYSKRDTALFQRLIANATVGQINEFPATKAYVYQKVTMILSYFGWAVIWMIIIIRNRRLKRKFKMSFNNENVSPALS